MVQPSISSQGSNNSILVSWPKPPGKVEYYMVYLGNISTDLQRQIETTNISVLFGSLSAGRVYFARVIAHSGPFNVSSEEIDNATCKYSEFIIF